MADQKASFTIDMKDQMSGPARQAKAALEQLKSAIQKDQQEIRALGNAQKIMQQGSVVNVAEFKRLGERMQTLKNNVAGNQSSYLKMGGSMTDMSKKTVEHSKKIVEQKNHMNDAVKSFDKWGVTSDKASASQNLAALGAAGAAAAILVVVAAAVAGTVALVAFAIAAADAGRTAMLMMVGFSGSVANAGALGAHIDQLSRKLPQTREQLRAIAAALAGEGLAGNPLVDATKAVATATAAMGSGAASKIQGIITRAQQARRFIIGAFDLRGSGISIDEVAAKLATQMKTTTAAAKQALMTGGVDLKNGLQAMNTALDAKFGSTIAALNVSLPTLKARAEEALGQLFSGIDINPLLKALGSAEELLEGNTVTGQALRTILKDLVQPLVSGMASVAPQAKAFFIGLVIGVVLVEIAFVKLHTWFKKLIPPEFRPNMTSASTAMQIGAIAAIMLAGAIVAVGIACLVATAFMALPFIILGVVIYGAIRLVQHAVKNLPAILMAMMPAWVNVGVSIVTGLIAGIASMVGSLRKVTKGMAQEALAAGKEGLKAKSPSRAFMELGVNVGEGFSQGIDSQRDDVHRATMGMIHVPAEAPAVGGARAGSGRSVSITFAPGSIVISGVSNARQAAEQLRPALTELLSDLLSGKGMAAA